MSKLFIYPTDTVWGIGCGVSDYDSFLLLNQVKETDQVCHKLAELKNLILLGMP